MTTATTSTSGTVTASADPNKGMVYLIVGTPGKNGTMTDMVQASGTLVSGDEVLTAAHVTYGSSGLRSAGTAIVGYNKGTYAAIGTVNAAHVVAKADYTTDAGSQTDFSLLHLSKAVSGGTVFALGSDVPSGTFNVSGYPAGTGGALDTQSQNLTQDGKLNVYKGVPLNQGSNNPHGSSGGPIWRSVSGTPTVYGDVSSMSSDGKTGYFTELTGADVKTIQGWMSADHGTAVASTPPAASTSTVKAAGTSTKTADDVTGTAFSDGLAGSSDGLSFVFSHDGVDALAADTGNASDGRAAVMRDVVKALGQAYADGGSHDDMISDAASYLRSASSAPRRALTYLAGFLTGATANDASGPIDVKSVLPKVGFVAADYAGMAEAFGISSLADAISNTNAPATIATNNASSTASAMIAAVPKDHASMAT